MMTLSEKATVIAAKAAGLRPDQVSAAISEYRAALDKIEAEPEWRAIYHMCGGREAMHQYGAEGTMVALQINCWKERGQWREERLYTLDGKPYETYSEARTIELEREAKFKISAVADPPPQQTAPEVRR